MFVKIEETASTAPGSTSPSSLKQINDLQSIQEQKIHIITLKFLPIKALIIQIVQIDQVKHQILWKS